MDVLVVPLIPFLRSVVDLPLILVQILQILFPYLPTFAIPFTSHLDCTGGLSFLLPVLHCHRCHGFWFGPVPGTWVLLLVALNIYMQCVSCGEFVVPGHSGVPPCNCPLLAFLWL